MGGCWVNVQVTGLIGPALRRHRCQDVIVDLVYGLVVGRDVTSHKRFDEIFHQPGRSAEEIPGDMTEELWRRILSLEWYICLSLFLMLSASSVCSKCFPVLSFLLETLEHDITLFSIIAVQSSVTGSRTGRMPVR